MKNWKKQLGHILGAQSVLLAALGLSAQAAAVETKIAPVEIVVKKSVFEDNAKNGKDPLFPKSARRGKSSPSPSPVIAPLVQLTLKGISGAANRRFALINNQPLAAGETAVVKIATGLVNVHCWEVLENSVIISIEGQPEKKELRLREGL
ncbi:MAG: hypothetical protein ABIP71_11075 [Verrucomicrobiota bacterium]